jgi:hypothetical protein
MKRRFESRVKLNQPVTMTAFQNDGLTSIGRFVDSSSNDMWIKSDADLEVGSLLRLEVGDDLMMTEVRHCEPHEGEYSADLLILSRLGKSELKRLLREAVVGPTPKSLPDEIGVMN